MRIRTAVCSIRDCPFGELNTTMNREVNVNPLAVRMGVDVDWKGRSMAGFGFVSQFVLCRQPRERSNFCLWSVYFPLLSSGPI